MAISLFKSLVWQTYNGLTSNFNHSINLPGTRKILRALHCKEQSRRSNKDILKSTALCSKIRTHDFLFSRLYHCAKANGLNYNELFRSNIILSLVKLLPNLTYYHRAEASGGKSSEVLAWWLRSQHPLYLKWIFYEAGLPIFDGVYLSLLGVLLQTTLASQQPVGGTRLVLLRSISILTHTSSIQVSVGSAI